MRPEAVGSYFIQISLNFCNVGLLILMFSSSCEDAYPSNMIEINMLIMMKTTTMMKEMK